MPLTWYPTVHIPCSQASRLTAYCLHHAPLEACGLLFGNVTEGVLTITRFQGLSNVSPLPERHFAFSPEEWVAALYGQPLALSGTTERLLGIFHSHPAGPDTPSREDLELQWEFETYAILSLGKKRPLLRCYHPRQGEQWPEQRVMIRSG